MYVSFHTTQINSISRNLSTAPNDKEMDYSHPNYLPKFIERKNNQETPMLTPEIVLSRHILNTSNNDDDLCSYALSVEKD